MANSPARRSRAHRRGGSLADVFRDPIPGSAVLLVRAGVPMLVLYPLARLVSLTFWSGGPGLEGVRGLLGDWTHRQALVSRLLLAGLVGIGGTILGFAFAFLAVRASFGLWATHALDAIIFLPLISLPFTAAIAPILSPGPQGLISYHVFGIRAMNIYGLPATLPSQVLT